MKIFGRWIFAILMTVACIGQSLGSDIRVAASIKPVHSLASAIMLGVEPTALLIKGTDSVHGYQLKPSDAKVIESADVLIWVGPNLESSLIASISKLGTDTQIIELSEARGLTLLPNRESPGAHSEEEDHEEEHHGTWNMHIWLDTDNAKIMAQEIATALQIAFPKYRSEFETNLNNVLQRLDTLEVELQKQAKPIARSPYVVFHDAYLYLEKRLNLNNVGAVTVNPERAPGAKKIRELREQIMDTQAVCVFSEPQFNPKILKTIAKGTELRFGVLDPLGSDINEGPDAYFQIMRSMVDSLRECLG